MSPSPLRNCIPSKTLIITPSPEFVLKMYTSKSHSIVYLIKCQEIIAGDVDWAAINAHKNIQKRFQVPLDRNLIQPWFTAQSIKIPWFSFSFGFVDNFLNKLRTIPYFYLKLQLSIPWKYKDRSTSLKHKILAHFRRKQTEPNRKRERENQRLTLACSDALELSLADNGGLKANPRFRSVWLRLKPLRWRFPIRFDRNQWSRWRWCRCRSLKLKPWAEFGRSCMWKNYTIYFIALIW